MNYDLPLSGILLLSDIDGTLLPEGKEIPENNITAIEKFKTLGGSFALCTGRSMLSATSAIRGLPLTNCPSVFLNGGAIYDLNKENLISLSSLPAAARCRVFEIIEKFPQVGAEVLIDCKTYCINHNELTKIYMLRETSQYCVTSIADLPKSPWNKAVFTAEPEIIEQVMAYTDTLNLKNEDYYFLRSDARLFEILPTEATKGNGLKKLIDVMGVKLEDVYAIGDYYNDIELLKAAGVPVTVANAPDEIKSYAKYITCDCTDGAVADLINHIIDQRINNHGI